MQNHEIVSYSQFRSHLGGYLDKVCDDNLPLVVTRRGGKSVVVIPEEDYMPMDETAYLLSTEANKEALMEALNGDPKDRIRYKSVDELREKLKL